MRKLKFTILACLAVGAGFVLGSWLGVERRSADFSQGVKRRLAENARSESRPASPVDRTFHADGEMLSAIMSAVNDDQPLRRAHRLHELLGQLSSTELAELFQRTLKIDNREQRAGVLAPLIARWEAVDPAAAEEAVRPYRERMRSGKRVSWGSPDEAVIRAWAEARPDLAMEEALAAPETNWSKWVAQTAFDASTSGDPAKQLEVLRNMPPNSLRASLAQPVITSLARTDSAVAESQLDLISDPRQRARIQAYIITSLAERDPAAALSRLSELTPELGSGAPGIRLVTSVMSQAASKDHLAAMAALDRLPEELKTAATGAALVGWVEEHPTEALAWAEKNGVDVKDAKRLQFFGDSGAAGWNSMLSMAFNNDREQTLAWVRQQPPSKDRDAMLQEGLGVGGLNERMEIYAELTPESRVKAMGNMISGLNRLDPIAAEKWVGTLPEGPERIAAVESLTALQINSDAGRVDELIAGWPPGSERDAAIRGVVNGLAQTDQVQATGLAAQITDPTARERAYVNIAQTWLYRDTPAARAWIASTPMLDADLKRYLLRQAEER